MSTTESTAVAAPVVEASVDATTDAQQIPQEETPIASEAEVTPSPEVTSAPVEEKIDETVKVEEEKKEKKHGRKPFSDLLSKIRRPSDRPEKKESSEATVPPVIPELPAADSAIPIEETAAPETADESAAETPVAQEEVTAPEAPAVEELKDITTPKKERGNIFEKIQAFVLKPKSPKPKKADHSKSDSEEVKGSDIAPVPQEQTQVQAAVEAEADVTESGPVEDTLVPTSPVTEVVPVAEVVSPKEEQIEEAKAVKKEKTPKDLAKLARRFSGRLFGNGEKKKEDKLSKPEATKEETETAEVEAEAAAPVVLNNETVEEIAPEQSSQPSEAVPVIAATA